MSAGKEIYSYGVHFLNWVAQFISPNLIPYTATLVTHRDIINKSQNRPALHICFSYCLAANYLF